MSWKDSKSCLVEGAGLACLRVSGDDDQSQAITGWRLESDSDTPGSRPPLTAVEMPAPASSVNVHLGGGDGSGSGSAMTGGATTGAGSGFTGSTTAGGGSTGFTSSGSGVATGLRAEL